MNIIVATLDLQIPEDRLKLFITKYAIIKQMHYIEKNILRVLTAKGILRIDLKITCAMKFDLVHLYLTG